MTEIDGVDIHFIHVQSPQHEGALPLIMTHGWPGSVIELLEVVGPLDRTPRDTAGAPDGRLRSRPAVTCRDTASPPKPTETGWDARSASRSAWADTDAAASATPAMSPRAAIKAPPSPMRWDARRPRA